MKKLIFILIIIFAGLSAYGQLDTTNIGTGANTGTGESIRSAFEKVNDAILQININTDSLELKLNKVDTLTLSNRIDAKLNATHESTYNHTNYNTAYTDRLKWDGGSTGLTAATGRTSLGGTTAGQALFTLTNPSAITFLRINADNTVTALSAANFKTALSLTASDVGLGNVTNESKATMFTNPVFTGANTTLPEGFYIGSSTMDASATELNVLNGIPGGLTATELGYNDGLDGPVQDQIDSLWAVVNDTLSGSSIYQMLNDTIPIVTFSLGAGLPADTACFNNNVLAGSFFNGGSDTLVVKKLVGILKEGTGTETIAVQVAWHTTFLSASATLLNSSALTVNSITTGTVDTSFANAKIPPNVFVWCILSGASKDNKPTFMNVTLSGNKIPKY